MSVGRGKVALLAAATESESESESELESAARVPIAITCIGHTWSVASAVKRSRTVQFTAWRYARMATVAVPVTVCDTVYACRGALNWGMRGAGRGRLRLSLLL